MLVKVHVMGVYVYTGWVTRPCYKNDISNLHKFFSLVFEEFVDCIKCVVWSYPQWPNPHSTLLLACALCHKKIGLIRFDLVETTFC
jgi:hypothetical protein